MISRALVWGGCVAGLVGFSSPGWAQGRSLFDATPAPGAAPTAQAAPAEAAPDQPKPRPKRRKPKGPVPARALTINNASANTLASFQVAQEGKSAKLSKPLAANKKTVLKLPAFKGCTVSVESMFEGQAAETSELDICKEKTIRFTE